MGFFADARTRLSVGALSGRALHPATPINVIKGSSAGRCLAELNNVERAIGIEKSAFPDRLGGAIMLPDVDPREDITGETLKQMGLFTGKIFLHGSVPRSF